MSQPAFRSLSEIPAGSLLYFVGISGISMCGLAEMALSLGFRVAGSDRRASDRTEHLTALGAEIFIGHDGCRIDELRPALVIHTAAVHADNPEWQRAAALGIPVIERSIFLGLITRDFERVINIAGTHGKTTTTAMCALILLAADADPTIHLGAELSDLDYSTVRMGTAHRLLVSEACEYSNSYHHFASTTAAVLNINIDHMDFFRDVDDLVDSFAIFTDLIRDGGQLVCPHRGRYMPELLRRITARRAAARRALPDLITFGAYLPPDLQDESVPAKRPEQPVFNYRNLTYPDGYPRFDLYEKDRLLTTIRLAVPGRHNVENAVAACACALLNGADPAACRTALETFTGAEGRFTTKGTYNGATVIADYAHHPTATEATLQAARELPHNHIWVVYQPLTYARVQQFFDDYVETLQDCEHTIFYEIYSDRENDDLGMSSRLLCQAIKEKGGSTEFAESYEEVVEALRGLVGPGDLILFLGPEQVRSLPIAWCRTGGTPAV